MSNSTGKKTPASNTKTAVTPAAIRPFAQSLPHALLRSRETTMRFFRPTLTEHDLTEQQWRVLRALHHCAAGDRPDPDVGELADLTVLLGPSLSRILANLEERNYIARTVDPDDQRRALISLTEDGSELVALIAPKSEAQYARIASIYGQQKLTELFALLEDLAAMPAPGTDSARPGH